MNILIVDASALARRGIRRPLERAGLADLAEARSGTEALRLLQTAKPRLVVTGADVDDMTGAALAAALRNSRRAEPVSVLLVAARVNLEDVLQAVDRGVDDYLIQPFSEESLVEKVRRALARAPRQPDPLHLPAKGYRRRNLIGE